MSAWRPGGLSLRELTSRVYRQLWDDEVFDRAAGLSYYFLFALFPTLLFLAALIGLLPIPDLMSRFMEYAGRVLPGDAASLLTKTVAEVLTGASGGLVSLGMVAALWAASSGMGSIMVALNVAYHCRDARPWWRRRASAIALTVAFSMFTLSALLLLVFGERIGEAVARAVGFGGLFTVTWNIARWPAVILCVLAGINLVYYLAPALRKRWRWVTPGSTFALAGWLAMSFALRLYVGYFSNYNATYGSIGGVMVLMLWLYVSGLALLIGAEIDSAIVTAGERRSRPLPGAPPARTVRPTAEETR